MNKVYERKRLGAQTLEKVLGLGTFLYTSVAEALQRERQDENSRVYLGFAPVTIACKKKYAQEMEPIEKKLAALLVEQRHLQSLRHERAMLEIFAPKPKTKGRKPKAPIDLDMLPGGLGGEIQSLRRELSRLEQLRAAEERANRKYESVVTLTAHTQIPIDLEGIQFADMQKIFLHDVRIGKTSVLASASPIPVAGGMRLPLSGKLNVGQQATLSLENLGDSDQLFGASIFGKAAL